MTAALDSFELAGTRRIFWTNAFPFGNGGSAVFPTLCYCAHSCRPNAFFYQGGHHGRQLAESAKKTGCIVSLAPIQRGSRIEISYAPRQHLRPDLINGQSSSWKLLLFANLSQGAERCHKQLAFASTFGKVRFASATSTANLHFVDERLQLQMRCVSDTAGGAR